MSDMQDYKSSLTDAASRKFETFSYLPEMTQEQIRSQVAYIVSKGWNPAVEHTEPQNAFDHYWYMWKLPMFGETDVDKILGEADACHQAHPTHHVGGKRGRYLFLAGSDRLWSCRESHVRSSVGFLTMSPSGVTAGRTCSSLTRTVAPT